MEEKMTIDTLAGMMKKEFDIVGGRFDKVDERFDRIEGRVGKIEAGMVTKDYLDEKLADLRGDLVVLTRKEDTKVGKLIEVLKRRKVISEAEEKEILSMEPFAKMLV
jgi:hypothetical protein